MLTFLHIRPFFLLPFCLFSYPTSQSSTMHYTYSLQQNLLIFLHVTPPSRRLPLKQPFSFVCSRTGDRHRTMDSREARQTPEHPRGHTGHHRGHLASHLALGHRQGDIALSLTHARVLMPAAVTQGGSRSPAIAVAICSVGLTWRKRVG